MAGLEVRDFSTPDETRAPDKTKVEIVRMGGASVARMSMQPGWRWSECIKPIVKTDTCQVEHIGYCVSGSLDISYEDGTKQHITPGMVYRIGPGHDGYNGGSEPAVFIEFQGAGNFAKG